MFNYDWFHGIAYDQQLMEARMRCVRLKYPEASPEDYENSAEMQEFEEALATRTLIYLRDGFSYEVKDFAQLESKSHLAFECEPVDEHYKVGAFVVAVPFDEIVRVEVFAVHPDEKPNDSPQITGFRHYQEPHDAKGPPGREM